MFSLPADVINKLSVMGHDYSYRNKIGIGEANCIMKSENVFYGTGDNRRDARALAY